jgi:hypothetical protein
MKAVDPYPDLDWIWTQSSQLGSVSISIQKVIRDPTIATTSKSRYRTITITDTGPYSRSGPNQRESDDLPTV